MADQPGDITKILHQVNLKDPKGTDQLFSAVYQRLREMAHRRMVKESPGQTFQTTDLVHEAVIRLIGESGATWENRHHFFASASEAMRRVLIDNARNRKRKKRGGEFHRIPLIDDEVSALSPQFDHMEIDDAIKLLRDHDERLYEIAMLRYFAGLNVDQVAEILEISPRTVDRDWRTARNWLYEQLTSKTN